MLTIKENWTWPNPNLPNTARRSNENLHEDHFCRWYHHPPDCRKSAASRARPFTAIFLINMIWSTGILTNFFLNHLNIWAKVPLFMTDWSKKFEYLKEEHLFFAAAFRSDDQNSLKEHDFELILEFYSNLIFQKPEDAGCRNFISFRDVLPWLRLHDCQMAAWRNEISACAACKTTGTWHAGKTCATLH